MEEKVTDILYNTLKSSIKNDEMLHALEEQLLQFLHTYTVDVEQLLMLKVAILKDESFEVMYGLGETLIQYEQSELKLRDVEVSLQREQGLRWISMLIDIFIDYFPIGTVIKIPDELIDMYELPHDTLLMIMQRLRPIPDTDYYAPYIATIYPENFTVSSELFLLNDIMIEQVVHRGYENEQDRLKVAELKAHCIQELGLKSFDAIPRIERMMTNGN
ncbi:DUF4176 domain-containing protein [Mammaliicoccus sp. Dog046]|uniref:DUF4176 domain-containing protein n=1 Tax=Mammaliicoccus sp. Dog046 TaxID=3034233 RepID=UPI002B25B660|nr:DUF4176 domain-containing protein [Mammaliicoccus sp. Dog046]WQK85415.1 DUF4176 domain-containing protein [Mammaliicoccus sp. Dog046]